MAHNRLMQLCNISIFNVSFKVCCDVKESSRSLFSKKKKQSYVMFITGKKKLHWALKNKVPLPRNQCVSSLSFCVCLSDSKWIQRYN